MSSVQIPQLKSNFHRDTLKFTAYRKEPFCIIKFRYLIKFVVFSNIMSQKSAESSDTDSEIEREIELAKKRVSWMIQRKKLRDHERLKRQKIEEYERKRAERIRMELERRSLRESRNDCRQDGGSSESVRFVYSIFSL